jgi:acetylornithine deacetylase
MTGQTLTKRDILSELVRFDTTSRESNLPLIQWIEDYLMGWGVPAIRIDYEGGRKTNLYATIGPDVEGGVVLSGHTDVVPVDGQPWTSDPFLLSERDGLLYGRGACDMKGYIAACLAMVPNFIAAKPVKPIHLCFSCDEEVGCRGVRPLVQHMKDHLPRPRLVIVGEPTSMQVVNAHKSCLSLATEVTGLEAHSSQTQIGVNAIFVAADLLGEVKRLAEEMQERGDPSGRFTPPYSTVHAGTIAGGTAKNIVPRQCNFMWEARLLPDADRYEIPERFNAYARRLEPAMKAVSPTSGIRTDIVNFVPSLAPETQSPAEHLALHLAEANSTHAVSYCTEAGLFQQIGIPAVICGPGSIEQAHKADEFVSLQQLAKCDSFLARLAAHAAAHY